MTSLNLEEVLRNITEGLLQELDAALARIWLVGPGDLCAECYKAADCANRERCLHLKTSVGLSTNLDGEYRRIPMGAFKIGNIAATLDPVLSNDVQNDEHVENQQWARENGLQSFAGYPLIFNGELLGVMGVFSRHSLAEEELKRLVVFPNQAAIAIKIVQLFAEVQQRKDRLEVENLYLQEEIKTEHNFDEIIGKGRVLKKVLRQLEKVAPTDSTVLILGETGTGKELVARAVHHLSRRRERPLVKVNCGGIPAALVESEMFGHEKGAFTGALERRVGRFELADGGTIFLDEIGTLPEQIQVKLLRVLQEGEFERLGSSHTHKVDVRVIAATNRNLAEAVREGSFRSDLFYRLHVFPLRVPPLRERKEDIPLLVQYFLQKLSKKLGKPFGGTSRETMESLMEYSWPGNIRELENVMERAAVLATGPTVSIDGSLSRQVAAGQQSAGLSTLQELEQAHILRVLEHTHWVIQGQKGAAAILGLHPNTLRSRMQKLGIDKSRNRS
jgi:transcriptional regulator with GAF, ATPase, and Fis domain